MAVNLLLPNEVSRILRLLSQAYMSSLPTIPVSMEDRIPQLASDQIPITCMVWNVQGAGSKSFMVSLKEIIRTHNPVVLVLVETHMGGEQAVKIASMLRYSGHTRVDAQGFSGRIWVYWKAETVIVEPILKHNQHITMNITRVGEQPWYFTAVYASPDPMKRRELWENLKEFTTTHNKPWLIAGDFNDTRYDWERSSACSETNRRSARFNNWVEDMELLEVEFSGASHTWARGLTPETRRSARLDRTLCNGNWGLRYSASKVKHLPSIASDHCPLLISPNGFAPLQKVNRPFRFQAAWMTHEKFQEFIHSKWNQSTPLTTSLMSLSVDLQNWSKEVFHNIFREKRHLMARLAGIQKLLPQNPHRGLLKLESRLRLELDDVLMQEELLWYQKSRVEWLKNGDRNTTFFHLSTIARQ